LGWDQPHLDATYNWFLSQSEIDLNNITIVLPGRRAARGLEERFATHNKIGQPRIVTVSELSDQLFDFDLPRANDFTRMLCWVHGLQCLDSKEIKTLIQQAPNPNDLNAWLSLAMPLRRLHSDLTGEMLSFAEVERCHGLPNEQERGRWKVLAKVQAKYLEKLAKIGQYDPHQARKEAIEGGQISNTNPIFLLGVIDLNKLQRQALALVESEATALVFAPENRANCFDKFGCVDVDAWTDPNLEIEIDDNEWTVVGQPTDQAEAVAEFLAQKKELSTKDISIAVLDDEVHPYLERVLHSHRIKTHKAEGEFLKKTPPWRLLDALANWLDGRKVVDLAALCRHADFMRACKVPNVAAELDTYFKQHLPHVIKGELLRDRYEYSDLPKLLKLLDQKFGPSTADVCKTPAQWAPTIQKLFELVWGEREFNPDNPKDAGTAECLKKFANLLHSFEALPEELGEFVDQPLASTLRLLLRETASQLLPQSSDKGFIELMGWLEMRMDPAKVGIVCGFNEGFVPESLHADAFLPNTLREALGIPDNNSRFARDAYSLTAMRNAHQDLLLICGRNSVQGDPRRPSRLLFRCSKELIAERMRAFLGDRNESLPEMVKKNQTAYLLPRAADTFDDQSLRVTDFESYLYSPYSFYLERVLGLNTDEDNAKEMNPLLYGNLIHIVLEDFGKDIEIRDNEKAEEIYDYLCSRLNYRSKILFGEDALPAVHLQVEQMRQRLKVFAKQQAAEIKNGWRIVEAELELPKEGIEVELNGEKVFLRAKIDRIDKHEEHHGYRILDYKSGDKKQYPYLKNKKEWKKLQLPLYRLIAKKLGGYGEKPTVGIWNLGKSEKDSGAYEPKVDDGSEAWEMAEKQAGDILRAIRSRNDDSSSSSDELKPEWPFKEGTDNIREPIFAAIAGTGLLGGDVDSDEEEE